MGFQKIKKRKFTSLFSVFNRKSNRYNTIQLTHLYVKDKERFKLLNKGNILVKKFKEFDVPSGVMKCVLYNFSVSGKTINFSDKKNVIDVCNRHLSKYQSKRIIDFIKKENLGNQST